MITLNQHSESRKRGDEKLFQSALSHEEEEKDLNLSNLIETIFEKRSQKELK